MSIQVLAYDRDAEMARADLLKKLLKSFKSGDDEAFYKVSKELIDDERKKHHVVLANELEKILNNGTSRKMENPIELFASKVPQDADRKTELLEIKTPDRYLSDLVLGDVNFKLIERVITEFREWEILESNGLSPVRRVLFCGPSGCGKTASAEAISTELGLPLLYVRFDAVISSLLGETAANLRKVFEFARSGSWVMLFDEFDAIGRSRDDITEHGEIKRVVNSFLQIMDNFDGRSLLIAATNFERALDPAVWRRFDDVIRFDRPNQEQVRELITRKLRPLTFRKTQVTGLTEQLIGKTFADVEQVCLDIRKSCALRGEKTVKKEDIEDAMARQDYRWNVLGGLREQAPTVDED